MFSFYTSFPLLLLGVEQSHDFMNDGSGVSKQTEDVREHVADGECPVDIRSNDNWLPTNASYSPSVPWTLNQTIMGAYLLMGWREEAVQQIPSQDLYKKHLWQANSAKRKMAMQDDTEIRNVVAGRFFCGEKGKRHREFCRLDLNSQYPH